VVPDYSKFAPVFKFCDIDQELDTVFYSKI